MNRRGSGLSDCVECYIINMLDAPLAFDTRFSRYKRFGMAKSTAVHLPPGLGCVTLLNMSEHLDIGNNLAKVRERMAAAARRAGRSLDAVTLVAVTKTHPVYVVQEAYEAGLREFGENRVGEAEAKIPAFLEQATPANPPRWHMIGHLQRRKVRLALELFDIIHSVDSLRLAERIERIATEGEKIVPVLLEVNVSGEASKYGFDMSSARSDKDRAVFFEQVEQILALPHLQVQGLMTMAPIVSDPEQARPVFANLRTLRETLSQRFPETDWRELSMGMTDDFEVAIEEGATMVRIGRAIFGARNV